MPDLSFELVIDPATEARVKRQLSGVPRGAKRALSAALNHTLEHGRTLLQRQVRQILNVSQKAALRAIHLDKATPEELLATLRVSRKEIPMGEFHPTQVKGPGGGVRVTTHKGKGAQLVKGAFIVTMPLRGAEQREAHVGVFKRKKWERLKPGKRKPLVQTGLPIRELYGPTVVGAVSQPGVSEKLQAALNEALAKNIDSQVDRLSH